MNGVTARVDAGGVLLLSGEVNFQTVPALMERALVLLANGALHTLDFSAVTRADSAGLAWLVEMRREARARGGDLVLRGVPAQLQSIARVCGVADLAQ